MKLFLLSSVFFISLHSHQVTHKFNQHYPKLKIYLRNNFNDNKKPVSPKPVTPVHRFAIIKKSFLG